MSASNDHVVYGMLGNLYSWYSCFCDVMKPKILFFLLPVTIVHPFIWVQSDHSTIMLIWSHRSPTHVCSGNYTVLKKHFYSVIFFSNCILILNSCMCWLPWKHDRSLIFGRAPLVTLWWRCLLKATSFHWDCMERYNSNDVRLHGTEMCKMAYSACLRSDFSSLMTYISSLPLRVTKMTDLSSSTGRQVLALLARWAMVATLQHPILLNITADQVIEKQPYLFSRFFHYFALCCKQGRVQ